MEISIVAIMTKNAVLIALMLVNHGVLVKTQNAENIQIVMETFYVVKNRVQYINFVKIKMQLDVVVKELRHLQAIIQILLLISLVIKLQLQKYHLVPLYKQEDQAQAHQVLAPILDQVVEAMEDQALVVEAMEDQAQVQEVETMEDQAQIKQVRSKFQLIQIVETLFLQIIRQVTIYLPSLLVMILIQELSQV